MQVVKGNTTIREDELNVIVQWEKPIFYNQHSWGKWEGSENFDVFMGCYDGVGICGLIGSSQLSKLSNISW